ncbi:hypothetical protein DL767_004252 [Monosporascus sp. MG133]|nr:hypothetical protein DL767_004252 [Monosporascus sp. MG133]
MATAHEEPAYENTTIHGTVVKPIQGLLGRYDARAEALQGVLDHPTKVEKEWQHCRTTSTAREGRSSRGGCSSRRPRRRARRRGRTQRRRRGTATRQWPASGGHGGRACAEAELTLLRPFVLGRVANDVVRIHYVSWGPRAISDPAAYRRLLDHAARGTEFQANNDLAGTDTRFGYAKSLNIAYSKPDRGPMKWIVANEWEKAMFDIRSVYGDMLSQSP